MAQRTNSPLKTFVLLVVVGGLAWLAYEYLYVRKVLAGDKVAPPISSDLREEIRDSILMEFEKDPCFTTLGPMSWRAKEGQWRIDLEVADGCIESSRDLCRRISDHMKERFDLTAAVWAFDDAGVEVGHHVP